MIPAITSNVNLNKVVVSTGNIINLKLVDKSNEFHDGLRLTLDCTENPKCVVLNDDGQVLRGTQELKQKITAQSRTEISIGAKLFLTKNSINLVEEAVNTVLQILQVQHVDNLVLAIKNSATTTTASGSPNIEELKRTWESLEEFVLNKQITRLGIADIDLETLSSLHTAARIKPTIAQINLATCCVVPTDLKEFCAKHEIQLLTHSDPENILSDEQSIIPRFSIDWALRYQVHVRCRGVLTVKGYIVGASNQKST